VIANISETKFMDVFEHNVSTEKKGKKKE